MHDDQYTATGPSHSTSGFPKTAFSTGSPSDFLHGVNVQAARCGVVGEGLQADTPAPEGSSDFPGVGVEGRGANFGVVGIGRQDGTACVYGHANRCRIGVLGGVMDRKSEGIGVVGASVKNLGNPLQTFDSIPEPADGSGIGVLGTSGRGPGVRGTSGEGSGGDFSSTEGAGVSATSSSGSALEATSSANRAAVFRSGVNVAQINLVPHEQQTREPALPKAGRVGDLLLIRNVVTQGNVVLSDTCSLWLCVPNPLIVAGTAALWQEVKLGAPVSGTL